MATNDTCCSILPYFEVSDENMEEFRNYCEKFVEMTSTESKCLYYGFTFNGNSVFCREGYVDAEGALAHIENVGPTLGEVFKIAELVKIEVHGPEAELAKLREPMAELNPTWYVLEYGFRK